MYLSSSCDSKKSTSTEESITLSSFSSFHSSTKFCFPPAPRLCKSANNTSCSYQSDSSTSIGQIVKSRRKSRKKYPKTLPPIGVFWDIENCQVPKNKSAAIIVQRIRELFFDGYREAEFIVVCDVKKENPQVIQDLHDAQVNLIHVLSTSKNAADEKLRQSLRRFAETHQSPATVVLISGDVNFAADLSDLRYRKKLRVILVHNTNVADALITCANETYMYTAITGNLPPLKNKVPECADLNVSNLPTNYEAKPLKNRLKLLSDNCGGKVTEVDKDAGLATIRFSSFDFALRAQRRLNGEDVFGRKIVVSNPNIRSHNSSRNFNQKSSKSNDSQQSGFSVSPAPYPDSFYQYSHRDIWGSKCNEDKASSVLHELNSFRTVRSCPPLPDPSWIRHGSFSRPKTPQDDLLSNSSQKSQRNFGSNCDLSDLSKMNNSGFQTISSPSQPVELMITNLDSSMKDIYTVLLRLLQEHAAVLNMNLVSHQDGSLMAMVKVASQQDAQNVISKIHHHKLGFKRISISYNQTNNLDPVQLKGMVITLLQEAPLFCMPLYRLLNLLEERYLINVSVSEVNKLKDVCRVSDENGERIISLSPAARSSQTSLRTANTLYCPLHCLNGLSDIEDIGWGNFADGNIMDIPHINMPLREFSYKLNALLDSHMGSLPLLSFGICYKCEFNVQLNLDSQGVPLEHLVTCVPNVNLKYGGPSKNIKYITRETTIIRINETDKDDAFKTSLSPSIITNISLLSRELIDLLRNTPNCQIQVSKFIPAYHHHFGRQLRVADYGYTKLSELLNSPAIANIIQILGEGTMRVITLTHSTQMKRFTSDLLKVLKSQASKQLTSLEFPATYEKVVRPFNPVEYGLCSLEDLLAAIPENTFVISKKNGILTIEIPKREQTAKEVIRTKQFAEEVVKLLSYTPQCSVLFNKFVPDYHHHFGNQCKVSDFGFTKLIELFEAIPETVKVEEMMNGERKVSLTHQKQLHVRGNQIADLIKQSELSCLPLEILASTFQKRYGITLKPQHYECSDMNEFVSKLSDFVQVSPSCAGPLVSLVENGSQSTLTLRVWALLINPPHCLEVDLLKDMYYSQYQCVINKEVLEKLNNVIMNNSSIFLTPPYAIAAKIYLLLYKEGGQIPYSALDNLYKRYYGVSLLQSEGETYEKLLTEFSFLIVMRRTKRRTNIALNPKIIEYGLPHTLTKNNNNNVQMMEENVSWPPPPMHVAANPRVNRGITPPKPDTPPARGTAPWKIWDTPPKHCYSDFSIPMPPMQTSSVSAYGGLLSPTKHLLPANGDVGSMISNILPPNPRDLPMPEDKLLKTGPNAGAVSDDSTDSGVHNSHANSENEMDISTEQTGIPTPYLHVTNIIIPTCIWLPEAPEVRLCLERISSCNKMDVVADILERTAQEAEKYKSISVNKHLELQYDLGRLLAVDNNELDKELLKRNKNDYLRDLTRDNIQLLYNKVWQLPTDRIEEAIVVKLPKPIYQLPRSLRVPKPKLLTKWQQFAKDKGIQKTKKPKLTWDEQLQQWIPRFGYKKAKAEKEKDWVLEVPQNADPFEDQFAKKIEAKSERVAKNELQRLRNIAKAKHVKVPKMGLLDSDVATSKDLQTAVTVAKSSTASVGKFQNKLPKEKEARGVADITPGASRKRKLPVVSGQQEKQESLDIVDSILNKKPKIDIEKAVNRQINNEQLARSEEKRSAPPPKSGKKRTGGNKNVGKKPKGGKGARKGVGNKGRKRR